MSEKEMKDALMQALLGGGALSAPTSREDDNKYMQETVELQKGLLAKWEAEGGLPGLDELCSAYLSNANDIRVLDGDIDILKSAEGEEAQVTFLTGVVTWQREADTRLKKLINLASATPTN